MPVPLMWGVADLPEDMYPSSDGAKCGHKSLL